MTGINLGSILKKAEACMKTSAKQKEVSKKVDDYVRGAGKSSAAIIIQGVEMAARKFIEVLQSEIESHSGTGKLGDTAIAALKPMEHGTPRKIGDNLYQIDVWFTENLSRDSLALDYYDGVENIAALLNNGYNAANTIYGYWMGHGVNGLYIPSRKNREGLHFIQNAMRDYKTNYAAEYGVIDIDCDDVYKTS